jgi:uncharacterized Zn finger protein (UPF0148 family)
MMRIQSLTCPSCGGPIKLPEGIDNLTCAYCGVGLVVQRGEGYLTLEIAELKEVIQESAAQTKAAVEAGTKVTQEEIKKVQIRQEISTAYSQLDNIRSQIQALEATNKTRKVRKQIRRLRRKEQEWSMYIKKLRMRLQPAESKPHSQSIASRKKSWFNDIARLFIVGLSASVVFYLILIPIVWLSDQYVGILNCLGLLLATAASIAVSIFVIYRFNPESKSLDSSDDVSQRQEDNTKTGKSINT